ncbi:hypothetical protein, conserved [Entamoeba dispar SAW760]|uniref:Uncharacterized protein n=1 Tax=Entamoeba dispar (strain ATCC PRA-260 / SAW760) TaxID=370354 RepID=B0EP65_ENTDS|nr:uncharacterized protein EDI_281920 [Entamoeba dispar SAW760]EDR23695.1 hypothetical protein, conserved [Entamoeba dispar SAW760]|eukprot:EDR23695.1 hypothetical protein, conserved [Entamoeba dispar SAW760]
MDFSESTEEEVVKEISPVPKHRLIPQKTKGVPEITTMVLEDNYKKPLKKEISDEIFEIKDDIEIRCPKQIEKELYLMEKVGTGKEESEFEQHDIIRLKKVVEEFSNKLPVNKIPLTDEVINDLYGPVNPILENSEEIEEEIKTRNDIENINTGVLSLDDIPGELDDVFNEFDIPKERKKEIKDFFDDLIENILLTVGDKEVVRSNIKLAKLLSSKLGFPHELLLHINKEVADLMKSNLGVRLPHDSFSLNVIRDKKRRNKLYEKFLGDNTSNSDEVEQKPELCQPSFTQSLGGAAENLLEGNSYNSVKRKKSKENENVEVKKKLTPGSFSVIFPKEIGVFEYTQPTKCLINSGTISQSGKYQPGQRQPDSSITKKVSESGVTPLLMKPVIKKDLRQQTQEMGVVDDNRKIDSLEKEKPTLKKEQQDDTSFNENKQISDSDNGVDKQTGIPFIEEQKNPPTDLSIDKKLFRDITQEFFGWNQNKFIDDIVFNQLNSINSKFRIRVPSHSVHKKLIEKPRQLFKIYVPESQVSLSPYNPSVNNTPVQSQINVLENKTHKIDQTNAIKKTKKYGVKKKAFELQKENKDSQVLQEKTLTKEDIEKIINSLKELGQQKEVNQQKEVDQPISESATEPIKPFETKEVVDEGCIGLTSTIKANNKKQKKIVKKKNTKALIVGRSFLQEDDKKELMERIAQIKILDPEQSRKVAEETKGLDNARKKEQEEIKKWDSSKAQFWDTTISRTEEEKRRQDSITRIREDSNTETKSRKDKEVLGYKHDETGISESDNTKTWDDPIRTGEINRTQLWEIKQIKSTEEENTILQEEYNFRSKDVSKIPEDDKTITEEEESTTLEDDYLKKQTKEELRIWEPKKLIQEKRNLLTKSILEGEILTKQFRASVPTQTINEQIGMDKKIKIVEEKKHLENDTKDKPKEMQKKEMNKLKKIEQENELLPNEPKPIEEENDVLLNKLKKLIEEKYMIPQSKKPEEETPTNKPKQVRKEKDIEPKRPTNEIISNEIRLPEEDDDALLNKLKKLLEEKDITSQSKKLEKQIPNEPKQIEDEKNITPNESKQLEKNNVILNDLRELEKEKQIVSNEPKQVEEKEITPDKLKQVRKEKNIKPINQEKDIRLNEIKLTEESDMHLSELKKLLKEKDITPQSKKYEKQIEEAKDTAPKSKRPKKEMMPNEVKRTEYDDMFLNELKKLIEKKDITSQSKKPEKQMTNKIKHVEEENNVLQNEIREVGENGVIPVEPKQVEEEKGTVLDVSKPLEEKEMVSIKSIKIEEEKDTLSQPKKIEGEMPTNKPKRVRKEKDIKPERSIKKIKQVEEGTVPKPKGEEEEKGTTINGPKQFEKETIPNEPKGEVEEVKDTMSDAPKSEENQIISNEPKGVRKENSTRLTPKRTTKEIRLTEETTPTLKQVRKENVTKPTLNVGEEKEIILNETKQSEAKGTIPQLKKPENQIILNEIKQVEEENNLIPNKIKGEIEIKDTIPNEIDLTEEEKEMISNEPRKMEEDDETTPIRQENELLPNKPSRVRKEKSTPPRIKRAKKEILNEIKQLEEEETTPKRVRKEKDTKPKRLPKEILNELKLTEETTLSEPRKMEEEKEIILDELKPSVEENDTKTKKTENNIKPKQTVEKEITPKESRKMEEENNLIRNGQKGVEEETVPKSKGVKEENDTIQNKPKKMEEEENDTSTKQIEEENCVIPNEPKQVEEKESNMTLNKIKKVIEEKDITLQPKKLEEEILSGQQRKMEEEEESNTKPNQTKEQQEIIPNQLRKMEEEEIIPNELRKIEEGELEEKVKMNAVLKKENKNKQNTLKTKITKTQEEDITPECKKLEHKIVANVQEKDLDKEVSLSKILEVNKKIQSQDSQSQKTKKLKAPQHSDDIETKTKIPKLSGKTIRPPVIETQNNTDEQQINQNGIKDISELISEPSVTEDVTKKHTDIEKKETDNKQPKIILSDQLNKTKKDKKTRKDSTTNESISLEKDTKQSGTQIKNKKITKLSTGSVGNGLDILKNYQIQHQRKTTINPNQQPSINISIINEQALLHKPVEIRKLSTGRVESDIYNIPNLNLEITGLSNLSEGTTKDVIQPINPSQLQMLKLNESDQETTSSLRINDNFQGIQKHHLDTQNIKIKYVSPKINKVITQLPLVEEQSLIKSQEKYTHFLPTTNEQSRINIIKRRKLSIGRVESEVYNIGPEQLISLTEKCDIHKKKESDTKPPKILKAYQQNEIEKEKKAKKEEKDIKQPEIQKKRKTVGKLSVGRVESDVYNIDQQIKKEQTVIINQQPIVSTSLISQQKILKPIKIRRLSTGRVESNINSIPHKITKVTRLSTGRVETSVHKIPHQPSTHTIYQFETKINKPFEVKSEIRRRKSIKEISQTPQNSVLNQAHLPINISIVNESQIHTPIKIRKLSAGRVESNVHNIQYQFPQSEPKILLNPNQQPTLNLSVINEQPTHKPIKGRLSIGRVKSDIHVVKPKRPKLPNSLQEKRLKEKRTSITTNRSYDVELQKDHLVYKITPKILKDQNIPKQTIESFKEEDKKKKSSDPQTYRKSFRYSKLYEFKK